MINKITKKNNTSEVNLVEEYFDTNPIALAVSGGPDSTAMMFLVSKSKKIKKKNVTVLIVDHDLRKDSRKEANLVMRNAKKIGFKYKILKWRGLKPSSGIQEAARKARYDMMISWCEKNNVKKLFLAHHLDDQVETFLMRLSKGSGIDGLSSMSKTSLKVNVNIIRPFLEIPKTKLVEIANSSNMKWVSDPSNSNLSYQRSRIRKLIPALSREGIDSHHINLVIKRMDSAKDALNETVNSNIIKYVKSMEGIAFSLSYEALDKLSPEILLRILERIIMVASGSIYPARRLKLEAILSWLKSDNQISAKTLSGTVLRKRKDYIIFYRELKSSQASASIRPLTNRYLSWDNRFHLKLNKSKDLEVKSLGNEGVKILKSKKLLKKHGLKNIPLSAWKSAPSLWSKKRLISVPSLGYNILDDLKIYLKSIRKP